MTEKNKKQSKSNKKIVQEKEIKINDKLLENQQVSPDAIMRFAAKLPPSARKKFLDTFNTLYIDEG